jgi:hypothetical protein
MHGVDDPNVTLIQPGGWVVTPRSDTLAAERHGTSEQALHPRP